MPVLFRVSIFGCLGGFGWLACWVVVFVKLDLSCVDFDLPVGGMCGKCWWGDLGLG